MLKNEFQLAYEQVHRYMVVPQGCQKESYGTDVEGEPDCVMDFISLTIWQFAGGFQKSCTNVGNSLAMKCSATAPRAPPRVPPPATEDAQH